MAVSTCIKCGSTSFEITEPISLNNSRDMVNFIQCSQCGGVVGVQEPFSAWRLIVCLAERIGKPINDMLR